VDLITLDVEMPRMDGLTFLRHLMTQHPMPVIVVSSVAEKGNLAGIQALELGAVDIVPKPGGAFTVEDVVEMLIEKIVVAAAMDRRKIVPRAVPPLGSAKDHGLLKKIRTTNRLIAMGSSTGGPQAFEEVFRHLPLDVPPILAVVHMPAGFTRSYAERLDSLCVPAVREATDGEVIVPGTIYIAPGGWHMVVRSQGAQRTIKLFSGPKVWNQRPAVDVLFDSVAENIGQNATGVLMTGMGRDGASGLLHMKEAGARTICQDEESCIVFGMPREAILLGAADHVVPLESIAETMLRLSVTGGS
jgi:two-component system chemotaxis response regulator CheB